MLVRITKILCCIILVAACPVQAQELTVLGGGMQDYTNTDERSYAWQIEYRDKLGEHIAYSISYLNEGHIKNHHRDGHIVQLWARTAFLEKHLLLSAGVGPFFYYDTTRSSEGSDWENDHGWGMILSCDASWYLTNRWYVQVRTNWNQFSPSFDTVSLLGGIGYRFDSVATLTEQKASFQQNAFKNEVTFFLGKTIVNSFGSELADARSIEYRRRLLAFMDLTVSWLNEGGNEVLRRNGLATQLWGTRYFFDDRLSLGVGGGAYFSINRRHSQNERIRIVDGIVTLTGNYRFFADWGLRLSWSRVVTSYNRDTDVILGGIGYIF
ncbi:MAG: hypothetical protein WC539_04445 [Nitrospirota bacterium]